MFIFYIAQYRWQYSVESEYYTETAGDVEGGMGQFQPQSISGGVVDNSSSSNPYQLIFRLSCSIHLTSLLKRLHQKELASLFSC